ncbi:MAG TPA: urea transporter [Ignavibacteriaceae bacterium]|nr:urea transporter [Ignavibacteriaceae bacterium]
MLFFIDSILYSYAQIFFCNRKWFGLLALLSTIMIPTVGFMALVGVVISNALALLLKFDKNKVHSGFYGFNGLLFGAATTFYFQLNYFLIGVILIFILISFFLSSVLENYLASSVNLPGLSLPFMITLYIYFIFLYNFPNLNFHIPKLEDYPFLSALPVAVKNYFYCLSLILFSPNIISGIILAAALLLFSRVMFLFSIISYAATIFFAKYFGIHYPDPMLLIICFNAILTSFAIGGSLILLSHKSLLLILITDLIVIIMAFFFHYLLVPYKLPVLVLPFNFIVLSILYSLKFRQEQSDLVLLYFQPGSPEENYYYHKNRKNRFSKFKLLHPELPVWGEWFISQAHNGKYTHKDQWKHAFDFSVVDAEGKQYGGDGASLQDYFCYSLPVVAPLDGTIEKIVDDIPDNKIGEVNIKKNWGNLIILKHENGFYSLLAHLKEGSFKVNVNDKVKKGDILAACGNSGRSPIPHLHFQFQPSDVIGSSTISYPFSTFIEKYDGGSAIKIFDIPKEGSIVLNPETNHIIKDTYSFKQSSKYNFNCNLNAQTFEEEWEVFIDINNDFYFKNNNNDIAYFYLTDKIFYFTNFIGNKKSALYYFYLINSKVLLFNFPDLSWTDELPINMTTGNFTRYISEIFLPFYQFINSKNTLNTIYDSKEETFTLNSNINVNGSGIFKLISKNILGKVIFNKDGINEFSAQQNNLSFSAKSFTKE